MSAAGLPQLRRGHSAVWIGSAMAIWGGSGPLVPDVGVLYSPATDTWTPMNYSIPAPSRRSSHSAVWTGSKMFVWGGQSAPGTGSLYCSCPALGQAIAAISGAKVGAGGHDSQYSWAAVANATGYDVTRGSLDSLRSSGGDFTVATETCLAGKIVSWSVTDTQTPDIGTGYWYLVRAVGCPGPGTYDDGSASLAAPRDPGILASGHGCP